MILVIYIYIYIYQFEYQTSKGLGISNFFFFFDERLEDLYYVKEYDLFHVIQKSCLRNTILVVSCLHIRHLDISKVGIVSLNSIHVTQKSCLRNMILVMHMNLNIKHPNLKSLK